MLPTKIKAEQTFHIGCGRQGMTCDGKVTALLIQGCDAAYH